MVALTIAMGFAAYRQRRWADKDLAAVTIDEFLAQIESKSPPAPEIRLRRFEENVGGRLPDDYRRFLISCNGGYVGGALWFKGPTPDGSAADAGVHHIGGFRAESYFSLDQSRAVYQGQEVRIPRSLVWIMDDPFGNAICLGITGPFRGRVYFWDHEGEPDPNEWDGEVHTAGNITILANGFTDFVAGLRPSDEEPEVALPSRPPPSSEQVAAAEAAMLELDRRFYDSLGPESTDEACKEERCQRGRVKFSVLCRPHHFENVKGRSCPFDH